PIEGVLLVVENESGNKAIGFPISDYGETQVPRSNKEGLMVFHHACARPEISGVCRKSYLLFPTGQCYCPIFYCRFVFNQHELGHVRIDQRFKRISEILVKGEHVETVERPWVWPS